MENSENRIDPAQFRHVLGHYPTGVTVVTGIDASGEILAMVVGTFTSVSLEPPLVSFLPMKNSRTFAALAECDTVCINVLTAAQEKSGRMIASRRSDKLDGIEWRMSPHGSPILEGSLAWLDVRITDTIEAGDHWIALCSVLDLGVEQASPPLIFFQGGYGQFMVKSLVARVESDTIDPVRRGARTRPILERVAHDIDCHVHLLVALNSHELLTVAGAQGPNAQLTADLGERIPIIPPIGDTYISGGTDEEVTEWLSRGPRLTDEEQALFLDRIAFCREHGHLVSFLPEGGEACYEEMAEAAQRFAQGNLTPAEEREVSEAISRGVMGYDLRELDDQQTYSLGSIVAPIPYPADRPVFTVRVSQLPRDASGAQINQWISTLHTAVDELAAALAD